MQRLRRLRLVMHLGGWALVTGMLFAADLATWPPAEMLDPPEVVDAALEGNDGVGQVLSAVGAVDRSWTDALKTALGLGASGCLVSLALAALYRRLSLARPLPVLFAGALAGTVVGTAAWQILLTLRDLALAAREEDTGLAALSLGLDLGPMLMNLFVMGAWHAVGLALLQVQRAARAEHLAQEARLEALRHQLNPHFLFNALNSAIAMIDEAPPRAQEMLTRLAGLLRSTLGSERTTTLGEELELIERYVDIERVRYEDKLDFAVTASAEARRCRIPPLTVHALVENAVKHGMRTAAMPLQVRLFCRCEQGWLRIDVVNDGRIDDNGGGTGVGRRNLAQRLDALYPGRHACALEELPGEKVRASVAIHHPEQMG